MRIPLFTVMLSVLAVGTAAWADDNQVSTDKTQSIDQSSSYNSQSPGQIGLDSNKSSDQVDNGYSYDTSSQSPGTSDDTNLATTAEASEVTRGYLTNEKVGFKPQVGVMAFTDQLGNSQGRAAYGFTLESNIASMIGMEGSKYYVGPETGFIYSHFGEPGSNFFGTNSDNSIGAAGANVFLIPADLKIGYNVTDRFRLAAHGGGNVLYRSVASAFNAGPSSGQAGSVWRIYPNGGGDVEYAFAPNVALMARPDVTVTPGSTLFTGTLALNIALG